MNKKINFLIQRVQGKDRKAERVLYDLYAGKVLAICRRYHISGIDVMDLHQECFIQVFNKISKFNPEKGLFGAWLNRVCINKILQIQKVQIKRQSFIVLKDIIDFVEPFREGLYDEIDFDQLMAFIEGLPNGYRIIFNLFAIDGWSHDEIAEKLKIAPSTSRSQYHRAKNILQEIILISIQKKDEAKIVWK